MAAPIALLAVLVFTVTASLSLSVGSRLTRLGFADGTADGGEWFDLGTNIATFGVLGIGYEPVVHRPPGYPLWVAAVLKLAVDPSRHIQEAINSRGLIALHVADSFLLALGSALLFLWLARRLRASTALAAALLLGTNAYSLVTATLVHYDILQWVLLLGLLLYFDTAFKASDERAVRLFFAGGVLLGIATLVRPVTLLAPFFLLPLFIGRKALRTDRLRYLALVVGMTLAIAPWTARNMALTGRLIPINVQAWNQLFASTSEVARHNPDRYEWALLTLRHFMPIYRRVTGDVDYSLQTYRKHILALEDAARTASIQNIISRPHVYLANVRRTALFLNKDVNAVILTIFTRIQTGEAFDRQWIFLGVRKAMKRGVEADVFQALHDLLLCAAAFGLGLAAWRRDFFLAPALAVWVGIVAVFALSYLDFFYYSVKVPFLIAFAFYGLDALPRALRLGLVLGVSALSLGLSWSMRLLG